MALGTSRLVADYTVNARTLHRMTEINLVTNFYKFVRWPHGNVMNKSDIPKFTRKKCNLKKVVKNVGNKYTEVMKNVR